MIEVCICTHNPRPAVLSSVIAALVAQDAESDTFRVTLIDNGSDPPVQEEILRPLRERHLGARLLAEPRLGLVRARLRAIGATDGEWILWVDDDNVLSPDFVSEGLRFIATHPEVGCFGGRLLLPSDLQVPPEYEPFLPFLGIRDLGDKELIGRSATWVAFEPPGAGAFVKREVLTRFEELAALRGQVFELGRAGSSLASCDDSLIMSCASDRGLALAYVPALRLKHLISPTRLERAYLRRLMKNYGESQVTLALAQTGTVSAPKHYANLPAFVFLICASFAKNAVRSLEFAIAMTGYHFAARRAFIAASL